MISAEKQRRVLELRASGLCYREISKQAEVSCEAARTVVLRGFVVEPVRREAVKKEPPKYALFGTPATFRRCVHGLMRHPCLACYLESQKK